MVFSSAIFLFCFLPLVLLIYYLLKNEYRNTFLLMASLCFYAWGEPKFVFIIILSIIINYSFGLFIHQGRERYNLLTTKIIMLIGVAANCGLLFYYKYYDFFIFNIDNIFGFNIALKHIILPIGISFFTFQGLSYVIDVYLRKVDVQKNLLKFALFKAFFPQLIAGPIVRYVDVHDQIDERTCNIDKFAEGIRRFILGLGKKIIIANTLGAVADGIFGFPSYQHSIATAWLGAICYTLQIYFDFSGYSDMAIGLAKMFGFEFKENFNYPYTAKNMTDFWRRWHISLSSWFRDYLYIPLGGNRAGNVYVNLLIVFSVTGLWHGAAWNFVIWGLWHGVFLISERLVKSAQINIEVPSLVARIYTLLIVVIGWVFFRAPDLTYALNYLEVMFGMLTPYGVGATVWYYLDYSVITALTLGCIGSIPIYTFSINQIRVYNEEKWLGVFIQNIYVIVILFISIMYISTSTYNPFIYFRF